MSITTVPGLAFRGQSANQRIEIKNLSFGAGFHKGGIDVSGSGRDFELGWLHIHDIINGPGHLDGRHLQQHRPRRRAARQRRARLQLRPRPVHNCNGVGVVNANIYNNAKLQGSVSPDICAQFGEAVEIQGAQNFWLLNSDVHDNYCTGMNVGAGTHVYTYNNVIRVRDTIFRGNGRFNTFNSSKTGYEGGGDSVPKEGAPAGTPFDAYGILQRSVFYGNTSAGPYVHHGSGFSLFINSTVYMNSTSAAGARTGQANYEWNQVAG